MRRYRPGQVDAYQQDFGQRVRSWRKRRSLTQEEVAFRAGIHVTYLSGIERGIRNPSLKNINAIAMGLEVQVAELFPLPESSPAAGNGSPNNPIEIAGVEGEGSVSDVSDMSLESRPDQATITPVGAAMGAPPFVRLERGTAITVQRDGEPPQRIRVEPGSIVSIWAPGENLSPVDPDRTPTSPTMIPDEALQRAFPALPGILLPPTEKGESA